MRAGCSSRSGARRPGWSHLAIDTPHTVVAQGYGEKEKEKDSYSDLRRILGHKGIGAARADLS
jgi:hypothetical protein